MRVIAGRFRRRLLKSLPGEATRPMLDRMRETLFNILQPEIEGVVFADLYAGTGAVGIEALSRGAREALLVESSPEAVRVIEENLRTLGAQREARIYPLPVVEALERFEADVYFLGPPYAAAEEYERTLSILGKRGSELVIAQHAAGRELPERYDRIERSRVKRIGASAFTFYRRYY